MLSFPRLLFSFASRRRTNSGVHFLRPPVLIDERWLFSCTATARLRDDAYSSIQYLSQLIDGAASLERIDIVEGAAKKCAEVALQTNLHVSDNCILSQVTLNIISVL